MRGLALDIRDWTPTEEFGNEVVGIIATQDYSRPDRISELISQGPPTAVYVIRENDKVAEKACSDAGVDPVVLPVVQSWGSFVSRPIQGPLQMIDQGPYAKPRLERRKSIRETIYDHRNDNRRFEMQAGCTRIWIFRKSSQEGALEWAPEYPVRARAFDFPMGRPKTKSKSKRTGRDPHA